MPVTDGRGGEGLRRELGAVRARAQGARAQRAAGHPPASEIVDGVLSPSPGTGTAEVDSGAAGPLQISAVGNSGRGSLGGRDTAVLAGSAHGIQDAQRTRQWSRIRLMPAVLESQSKSCERHATIVSRSVTERTVRLSAVGCADGGARPPAGPCPAQRAI